MSVPVRITVVVCVLALAAAGLCGLAFATVTQVRVNGPIYGDVAQASDVTADVLPPPLYLVEAYLTAHRLADEQRADARVRLVDDLTVQRLAFDRARDRWAVELPDGPLRRAVLDDVVPTGERLWSLLDTVVVPAAQAGDTAAVREALGGEGLVAYQAHRGAVDATVAEASRQLADAERRADDLVVTRVWLLVGGSAVFALVAAAGGWWLVHSVRRPLQAVAAVTATLAAGRPGTAPPAPEGHDDLGRAGAAVNRSVATVVATTMAMGELAARCRTDADRLAAVGGTDVREAAAELRGRAAGLEEALARLTSAHAANAAAQAGPVRPGGPPPLR